MGEPRVGDLGACQFQLGESVHFLDGGHAGVGDVRIYQGKRTQVSQSSQVRQANIPNVGVGKIQLFELGNPVYSPANAAQPLDFLILSVKSSICKGCHGR